MHNLCFVSAAFLALSGIAYAQPDTLPPLPPNPPSRCVAKLQQLPAVAARVSAANCLAQESMNLVPLTAPTLESANELATAVAPSIALLDNVIALGDPYWTIVAEDAKRDTYASMAVRLRRTVQPGDEVGGQIVDMLTANWLDNVALANVRITEIAENNPRLATGNDVIAAIANRAASAEATEVATRARNSQPGR